MNERDIQYQQNICYKRGLEQGREEGSRETAIKSVNISLARSWNNCPGHIHYLQGTVKTLLVSNVHILVRCLAP